MAESDPSMSVLQTHQQPQSTNHPHIAAAKCAGRKESKLASVKTGDNTEDWNGVRIKLVTRIYGIARRGSVLAIIGKRRDGDVKS
jgi:hypothetical protein